MLSTNTTLTSTPGEKEVEKPSSCPACASPNCTDEGPNCPEGFRRCRCRECHLIFSSPMQAADSAWYASSWIYSLRTMKGESRGEERRVPWNFAKALRRLRSGKGSRLLDVGCAEGQFLHLAAKAGYEVTGLDFNPVSVEIARKLLGVSTVYSYAVEELGHRFLGAQFDVVTIFEVLEHTADPYQTVRSIYKLLKPGGQLFLSVPGNRRWPGLFHPEVDAAPHHLTLWSEEALVSLLERGGLRVQGVEIKALGAEDLGIHLKWRWHHALRKFRPKPPHDATPNEKTTVAGQQGGRQKRGAGMGRELAMLGLSPLCWVLRLHPRAGGFTLFAHCEKV
jgi:SAM-dependent methyltransferase